MRSPCACARTHTHSRVRVLNVLVSAELLVFSVTHLPDDVIHRINFLKAKGLLSFALQIFLFQTLTILFQALHKIFLTVVNILQYIFNSYCECIATLVNEIYHVFNNRHNLKFRDFTIKKNKIIYH